MKKLLTLTFAFLVACTSGPTDGAGEPLLFDSSAFDTLLDGRKVSLYTLRNENGMAVQLTNYGARIVSLWVPASDGTFRDVVTGFETIDGYLTAGDINNGPVVGRYGNRIAKGRFSLDGHEYQLTVNENGNHLHGGTGGFSSRVWSAHEFVNADGEQAVEMKYLSPDGEDGYPGNLNISVVYTLTADNRLIIRYGAASDAATVLNPTSHSYFNLHGTTARSTDSHILKINSGAFTPTDARLIPTGEIATVDGTPLDFRRPTAIGERINEDYEALKFGGGYDHNWILDGERDCAGIVEAAEVWEPATGIVMTVHTDQPALQFYSGNFMDSSDTGKRGEKNHFRTGIALETQNYPDAPNHPHFPSATLRPGEVYKHTCIYSFSVK